MRIFKGFLLCAFIAALVPVAHAGVYTDGNLTVDMNQTDNGLTGTFTLNGQSFPAKAQVNGNDVTGSFNAGGTDFPFTATLNGDAVTLVSGGRTYNLKAKAPAGPANPLGGPGQPVAGPAQPPAPPVQGGNGLASNVPLTEYKFPDGTGTIGVADGWKTQAQSGLDPVFIQGPADNHVAIGISFIVNEPDSQMVQMMRQSEAQAKAMNMPMPPGPKLMIAKFAAPAEALQALVPQISEMYVAQGGPSIQLERITSAQDMQARMPNGKAAVLEYDIIRTTNGQAVRIHNMSKVECTPAQGGGGMWGVYLIELGSPAERFAQDKPVMLAMLNSMKANTEVCQRVMQERQRTFQQQQQDITQRGQDSRATLQNQFDQGQRAYQDRQRQFDAQNQQWSRDQNAKARANDNFIETIRGERTVLDTQTGQKSSVDLGNVDNTVNQLNQQDPGRYQQIPLRDENNPLPNNGQ